MSTVILKQALKLLIPLSLLFAVFVYFKGHQTPGGGFVGGLVVAVAILLGRMGFGGKVMAKAVPIKERTMIAIGLLLALCTGLGAIWNGLPFLTSNNGYMSQAFTEYHWATVAIFDLGVVFVVAGVVVGMISSLTDEVEAMERDEMLDIHYDFDHAFDHASEPDANPDANPDADPDANPDADAGANPDANPTPNPGPQDPSVPNTSASSGSSPSPKPKPKPNQEDA